MDSKSSVKFDHLRAEISAVRFKLPTRPNVALGFVFPSLNHEP